MERSGAAPRRAVCEWPGRAVPAGRGGGGLGGRSGGVGVGGGRGRRTPSACAAGAGPGAAKPPGLASVASSRLPTLGPAAGAMRVVPRPPKIQR